jgi:hypothetical protein
VTLFLICSSLAVLLGVCCYLSLVRPSVRSHTESLDEIRLLETWWHLDASDVTAAGDTERTGRIDDAA